MPIRIFIDQGHNPQGVNAGAEGNGLREQDVTYNVGVDLAGLLNDDPRFEARLSRNTPTESLGYQHPLQRKQQPRYKRQRSLRLPRGHPGLLAGPAHP